MIAPQPMIHVRYLLLPVLCMMHLCTAAQAPFWEWARAVTGTTGSRCWNVQAVDGGCFAPINAGSLFLQNDTLWGSGFMVFVNSFGELRMGVEMSPPHQMRDIGNGRIGFLSKVHSTCIVDGVTYTSELGLGLLTGTMDTSGTIADVQASPNLIIGHGYHQIIDIHQGTSGKLYVLGSFSDSIAVADTMLYDEGMFVARFTDAGELIRADRYDFYPYYDLGSLVEGADGTLYVAIQSDAANALGQGMLLLFLDTEGSVIVASDDGNTSFYQQNTPRLSAAPNGGVFMAYVMYAGSGTVPIRILHFSPAVELVWENIAVIGGSPDKIEATQDGGVLVSGPPNFIGARVFEVSAENVLRWTISNGTSATILAAHASMNNAGEIYVAGWFDYTAQFGTHFLPNTPGKGQAYIAKIGYGFLGINDNSASPLSMFPNPTNDHFRVTLPEPSANWVQVIDQQGRVIHEERTTGQQVDIDVTGIRPGSYVVRSGTSVGQLIVQ